MAAKKRYLFSINLGLLGFISFLYLFEISRGEENFPNKSLENNLHDFFKSDLSDTHKKSSLMKSDSKEFSLLSLKIFADKQYDYDQNIYLAEGNVKALLNDGILSSDLLSFDKSTGILSAEGNIKFRKGGQYFRAKEFNFNLLKKEGLIR